MNEDFVTYDQAVKLKELGFDWKVRACYRRKLILDCDNPHYTHYTEPKFVHNDTMRKRYTSNYNDNRCGGGSGKYYYSAPTLAQAQKWLREVKNIIVLATCNLDYVEGHKWYWFVDADCWIDDPEHNYDTYEEALSIGIDKALELLKEQSNA